MTTLTLASPTEGVADIALGVFPAVRDGQPHRVHVVLADFPNLSENAVSSVPHLGHANCPASHAFLNAIRHAANPPAYQTKPKLDVPPTAESNAPPTIPHVSVIKNQPTGSQRNAARRRS